MTSENSGVVTTMPMAPVGYGYGNGGGMGWGNDIWLIIIILFALGGFGGFGMGGGYGMGGYGAIGGALYPWMNQADITTSGFQNAATNQAISSLQNSVTSGFGDVQTSLCAGFAGVNAGLANGFAQAEIGANARQMANMNQMFGLSTQLAQASCDNKAATNDVKYTIATEACANRATSTANTQAILDKLCQLELDNAKAQIDAKNDTIAQLRQEVLYARGQASQDVQTAAILAGQTAEVDALYNRLNNCPVSTVPVYGRQPIFTCGGNSCGCNCGM